MRKDFFSTRKSNFPLPHRVATQEMIEYHFQSCLLSARRMQDRFILIAAAGAKQVRSCRGRVFFFSLLLLFLLSSCHSSPTLSPEEVARRDSAALHVALMPVQDCFPFYLAERTGIYERLGVDVRIRTYMAQLDIDTTLACGHVEVAYSDLARAIMLQQDSTDVRAIASFDGRLDLITPRKARVRKLNQLKEKMVAVARHSVTDYWSDRLTDTASFQRADIFRPQINSLRIRTDMLCNGTMDAVFLPEPFASEAIMQGNTLNFSTAKLTPRLVALVATQQALNDKTRRQQIDLLLKGYDEAVELLANTTAIRDSIPTLLRELCQTPDSLTDSLTRRLPRFVPIAKPQATDVEEAMRWLRTRDKIKKGYSADSLITPLIP